MKRAVRHDMSILGNPCFVALLIVSALAEPCLSAPPSDQLERDRGLIVQFSDSPFETDPESFGNLLSNLRVIDRDLNTIFISTGIIYARPIFIRAHSTKIVNGRARSMPSLQNTYILTASESSSVDACIRSLRDHPDVIYAEPNILETFPLSCPDPVDPLYDRNYVTPYQWWFTGARSHVDAHINIEPAWNIGCGESTTRIGLLDQGVYTSHEDIGSRCTNFGGVSAHGTYVYGILAATANNVGITGMIQNAETVSIAIGTLSVAALADSIISAVDTWHCNVLSTSSAIGVVGYSYEIVTTLKNAIDYAFDSGVPFVAAAGNSPIGRVVQPAFLDEVIAVGASDTTDSWRDANANGVPDYNHGRQLDILAPGEWLITTGVQSTDDYYLATFGTSFSQPIVAGTVALMHSALNYMGGSGYSSEDYAGMINAYAHDLSTAGYDTLTGWGRIDVGRTLENMGGRYTLVRDQQMGGALVDSTAKLKIAAFGFHGYGLKTGDVYRMKRFTIERTVTWPEFADGDSVFCWGESFLSNGLRDYVRSWSYVPEPNKSPNHLVFNRNMCYPVYTSIDEGGAILRSYYYRVYYGMTDSVIAVLGESDPDSVAFSFAVVGPVAQDKSIRNETARQEQALEVWHEQNPARSRVAISFRSSKREHVTLSIYDLRGRLVRVLLREYVGPGDHHEAWDGCDFNGERLSTGVYCYRIDTGTESQVKKFTLIR